jgi:hypothetical protein
MSKPQIRYTILTASSFSGKGTYYTKGFFRGKSPQIIELSFFTSFKKSGHVVKLGP